MNCPELKLVLCRVMNMILFYKFDSITNQVIRNERKLSIKAFEPFRGAFNKSTFLHCKSLLYLPTKTSQCKMIGRQLQKCFDLCCAFETNAIASHLHVWSLLQPPRSNSLSHQMSVQGGATYKTVVGRKEEVQLTLQVPRSASAMQFVTLSYYSAFCIELLCDFGISLL